MKTILHSVKAVVCLVILLNSCTTSKNAIESIEVKSIAKTENASCFVVLNDGTIKNYTTLKLVTAVFKTPHLLADENEVITPDAIKAYQNNQHYAIAQKDLTDAKASYVAVNTLPGFAIRVAKGKINVYTVKYYNGQNTTDKFYLQDGENGEVLHYTPELLNQFLKDNNIAFNYFNNKKIEKGNKTAKDTKRLLAAVDIYNNTGLITKN